MSEHDDGVATPADFASELFAMSNQLLFDEYIAMRVQGVTSFVAFRTLFGDLATDNWATARIYALEHNPYYRRNFKATLDATPIDQLWNPKIAMHELLQMVRDKFAKETARMNAIKELNVLCEITIVDENGKTKAGRGLDDFYAKEGNGVVMSEKEVSRENEPTSLLTKPHTTH